MRGYAAVGLDRCKDRANVGGVLRAAGCFGVKLVVVSGGRLGNYNTDTMKAHKQVPCLEVDDIMSVIPYGAIPVAIEITDDAKSLYNFVHPDSAFYIFGPEDGSIKKEIMDKAVVVVRIPSSHCLNLAATVNIVLYDRAMKQSIKDRACG